MKKRILSALLVLALACGLVSTAWANEPVEPVATSAASQEAVQGDTTEVEVKTAALDGSDEGTPSGEVTESQPASSEEQQPEASAPSSGADAGGEATGTVPEGNAPENSDAATTPESQAQSAPSGGEQPGPANNSITSDTPNLLADGTYNIDYGETIQLNGQQGTALIKEHSWWIESKGTTGGVSLPSNMNQSSISIKGTSPGTVIVKHQYKNFLGGKETETFTINVSDQALVYVYVASKVTDADGSLVQPERSWADNPEFLRALGLSADTVDGNDYFPVGEIKVDYRLFQQNSPYLNADTPGSTESSDWNTVAAALAEMDTSTLQGKYAANKENVVSMYVNQAIRDIDATSGQQKSAMFDWSGSSNGFDRQAGYHLDLRFRTSTITFKAADNGLDDDSYGQYQDLSILGYRVYITGATIEEPEGIGAPDGYTIEGYYTDEDCMYLWDGVGTPLKNDVTVFVKYTERANVTINYQAVGLEDTVADAVTPASETFNPAKNPTGSTATAPDGYKFVGWYSDQTCETLVSTANTFVPTAPDGGWKDGKTYTYYAKFEKLEPLNLDHAKYVKANPDGSYDLTLNVTGSAESDTQTVDVDVLMILDTSGSMTNNYSKRLANAKTAMQSLINSLEAVTTVNARYSIVRFDSVTDSSWGYGSAEDASVIQPWAEDSPALRQQINQISSGNGTNYQAGLEKGAQQLSTDNGARESATKVVIFLSDGTPSFANNQRYDGNGYDFSSEAWTQTTTAASALKCDRFYSVGIGQSTGKYLDKETGIAHYVNAEISEYIPSGDDEGTDLSTIFAGIAGSITSIDCSNVKITDTLSQYAKLTSDAEFKVSISIPNSNGGSPTEVTATVAADTVKNAGSTGYSGVLHYWTHKQNGSVTAEEPQHGQASNYTEHSVNFNLMYSTDTEGENGTFSLAFNNDYALENGWTYSITTQIEPTEQAYTDYRTNIATEGNNGYGETVGDPDTDAQGNTTSSGQPGFYSNSSAKLTYISNGVSADKDYARPVIQVTTGTLSLEKAVNVDAAKEKDFTFTITKLDGDTNNTDADFTYTFDGVAFENGVATVIVKGGQTLLMTGLPSGRYTVAENNSSMPSVDGYNLTGTTYQVEGESASTSVTVQVNAAGTANVTVTNTYAPQYQTLTVTKTVGGEMGSYEQDFTFTLHLTKDGAAYTGDDITGTKSLLDGTGTVQEGVDKITESGTTYYQFTLKHNQKIEIQIPYGCVAEVAEANGNYTAESVLDSSASKGGATVNNISMVVDHQVAYTNTLSPVAPTGLESNHTAPYTLMITAAGIAGLALIGSVVARRVRRRREE